MGDYMRQAETIIGRAFVADKLAVHHEGAIRGPHTLTYCLKLYQPTKANVARALSLAPALEATLGLAPVRVYAEQGAVMVEIPSPAPVVVYGRRLQGAGLAVPLGLTTRQTIAGVDFAANPHMLLVGPTRRGKTTALRALLYHLAKQNTPAQLRAIFASFKVNDTLALAPLATVILDAEETAAMITWAVGLMNQRARQGQDSPRLFLFLDDLANLLGAVDVADQLGQLASLGGGVGIHLVIGTQRVSEKGAGAGLVTGNMPVRLVFGTASAQDAAQYAGRGETGAEKLGTYKGDALLVSDGATQRLAVALVTDEDLARLPARGTDDRPWNAAATPVDRPVPVERSTGGGGDSTRSDAPRASGTFHKLRDAPPNAGERAYLRALHAQLGSKRAVLRAAWGGVVNESGKTPKTQRWLDESVGA